MKNQLYFCLIFFAFLFNACLADIRTKSLKKEGVTTENTTKARQLLTDMAQAHGIKQYHQQKDIQVLLRDEWNGFFPKKLVMPWEKSGELLQLQYAVGTENGRLTFQENDHKDLIWGIQNWATYTQEGNEVPDFKNNKKIKFWVPTVQYFVEMPFAIQSAQIVAYAGEEIVNGEKYDLVYATWNDPEPNKKMDQYLLWIHQETKLLGVAEYTVRDMARFITGKIWYTDYKDIDGVKIAFSQKVTNDPEKANKFLHWMKLESVNFNVTTDENTFVPKPDVKMKK